jgi:pimeloyl-ACP methyl ester carboxylesterase
MITEDRACFGGVHTRCLSVAGSGVPIALLHGFADSADTWRGVLTAFHAAGRAAFAVDMPGYGHADPRGPGVIMAQLDAFIEAMIADTGALILMGNSLGACVSVRAAARGHGNIRGVVAVDEPILASHLLMRLVRRRADPLRVLDRRMPIPKGLYHQTIRRAFARLLYADPAQADPDVLARFTIQAPDPSHLRQLLGDARTIALETAAGYDSDRVVCPLLVIHGRKDRIIPVHASQRLHESVPGSTLLVLPKAGHCPQLDDPPRLAGYVLRFLDSEVDI